MQEINNTQLKLAERLIESRIAQIELERISGGWKPILPIEKVFQDILNKIPKWSFVASNDCHS